MNHEALGQMVREARLARGMTQRQLAELAGLHQNQVNGIENAHLPKYYPKLLNAIVDALDLDRDEVFALAGRITPDIEAELAGNVHALKRVRKELAL